jgi:L-asparaginase
VLEQVRSLKASIVDINVMTFPAFPAWARSPGAPHDALIARLLQASLDQGVTGLILESYEAGNFPSGDPGQAEEGAVFGVLKNANDRGVVIVDCTQVLAGNVNATLYAAGSWLGECGVIGANDMTPIASLAKLLVLQGLNRALQFGWTPAQDKALMQRSLAGEITEIDRLDSFGPGFLAPTQSLSTLDGSALLRNDPQRGPMVVFDPSSNPPLEAPMLDTTEFDMPGRLNVADDGIVTFTDRRNVVRHNWVPGEPASACRLVLSGVKGSTPTLEVWSAATNQLVMEIILPMRPSLN